MSIGVSRFNPTDYTGPNMNLAPIRFFTREPSTSDKKYNVGQLIIIGKNPSSGTQGDIWYLSKFDGSGDPQWVQLLTGAGSPGVDSLTTDDGAPAVQPDGNGNINILGGNGISVTGQGPGNDVTIAISGSVIGWSVITAATKTIDVQNGYFANKAGGVAFTLPAVAAVGDTFAVSAIHASGWSIAQNAGQTVRYGNITTTTGAGGSLASTANGDTVTLVCSVANTNFQVINSIGNITYV